MAFWVEQVDSDNGNSVLQTYNPGAGKLRDTSDSTSHMRILSTSKGTLPPPSLSPEMDTPNNACQVNDQMSDQVTRVGKAASPKERREGYTTEGPSFIISIVPTAVEKQPTSPELS